MKNYKTGFFWVLTGLLLCAMASAQEDVPDQVATGEAGYKVGCSAAASIGIVSCGELPSGKKTQKDRNAADATAAISAVQELSSDAANTLASTAQALSELQKNCDDSEDTCAAVAATLQKLKEAANDVVSSTPDAFTVAQPYTAEAPSEKVPAYTVGQRVVAWGIEHIPSQETQNTPPDVTGTEQSPEVDVDSENSANMEKYSDAVEQYQQALQTLGNVMASGLSRSAIQDRYMVPSAGPQIRAARPTTTQSKVPYQSFDCIPGGGRCH